MVLPYGLQRRREGREAYCTGSHTRNFSASATALPTALWVPNHSFVCKCTH